MSLSGGTSRRDVTAFDYVSDVLWDQADQIAGVTTLRVDGGPVQPYKAGTATPVWGQVAGVDTSATNQVIQQPTSNIVRALGVFVGQVANGRGVFGPNCYASEFGPITVGSTLLFVQVRGKVYAYADGTINIGDLVTASTTTAGYVTANNSPSTGQTLGRALSATTTSGQQVLVTLTGR